jgi:hypothetical protein
MPTVLKALPFDERNDRDFDDLTNRIRSGLDSIRKSTSLKPTQDTLAKLAQCFRRTLSLRRWPIEELNRIKRNRKTEVTESTIVSPVQKKLRNQRESDLISQIKNYQEQNGLLFDRVQTLEEDQARSSLIQKALEEQLTASLQKVTHLEKESRITNLRVVET